MDGIRQVLDDMTHGNELVGAQRSDLFIPGIERPNHKMIYPGALC